MPVKINGLPAHVLLVHLVVVLIPLAVLCLLATVFWPAARRRLGIVTPGLALVALACVPVTTHAGEWLEERVYMTPLIAKHTKLGDGLLPWAIGLFVMAAVAWIWFRISAPRAVAPADATAEPTSTTEQTATTEPTATTSTGTVTRSRFSGGQRFVGAVVIAVLAVGVSAGSLFEVYRIGDSGAKAAWDGNFTDQPRQR